MKFNQLSDKKEITMKVAAVEALTEIVVETITEVEIITVAVTEEIEVAEVVEEAEETIDSLLPKKKTNSLLNRSE